MIHPKTLPYNQTRDHSTGGSHHSSDRGSNSTSGSQNQKKGTRAPKIPKHNAVTWGEAPSPPHPNAWDCDEYSLPMERSFDPEAKNRRLPDSTSQRGSLIPLLRCPIVTHLSLHCRKT
ncbi:Roundabout-like protein 1 [Larimichthys crocea]|uniref:Uncharacterized protein n=1 Tax=Larimichthys crocea TaxID=215358 RepID=A0ACD3R525_LARCR|nr:Roundabout-like protein 1 [Larimichthys crocea]